MESWLAVSIGSTTSLIIIHFPHPTDFNLKSLYLDNFSVNFAEVLLSDGAAMSISMHLLSFLSP